MSSTSFFTNVPGPTDARAGIDLVVLAGGAMEPLLPDLTIEVMGMDVLGFVEVSPDAEAFEVGEATLPRLDCGPVLDAPTLTPVSAPAPREVDFASDPVVDDRTTPEGRGATPVLEASLAPGKGESARALGAVVAATAAFDLVAAVTVDGFGTPTAPPGLAIVEAGFKG